MTDEKSLVTVVQALALTAELTGAQLSDAAKMMMVEDLSDYDAAAVVTALSRCRRELKGRLTLAEIIARIDDGRPGPEEAWAMLPRDEERTVVWTEEMIEAWGVALPLLSEGDEIAARMAFRESYSRRLTEARSSRKPTKWSVSLGTDPDSREQVLLEAVKSGRLGVNSVERLLPHHQTPAPFLEALKRIGGADLKMLNSINSKGEK